ncbi:MAG: hypothetical protein DUW69_002519 [Verrucomicrobia bacterium]|nr:MAG: hypothetical protein DUW69_002519 [Verrucomicrobiota bacterium]
MKSKPALIWVICLGLGFAGGWLSRGTSFAPATSETSRADSLRVVAQPVAIMISPPSGPAKDLSEPADSAAAQRSQVVSDLNTLVGERKRGLYIAIPVFGADGLEPTFAKVYGLSPEEISALNEAIKATKGKFTALAIQTAKAELSADGSRLVVEVPSVTDQGGGIYDQLLQSFEGVLGPDRFQSFNALSGAIFDTGFGSFGIWNTRYEVSVATPKTATWDATYRITMNSTGPNGSSNGNFTLHQNGLSTQYPVLSHFISAGFVPKPGGK